MFSHNIEEEARLGWGGRVSHSLWTSPQLKFNTRLLERWSFKTFSTGVMLL
jgi:hypothetical protein